MRYAPIGPRIASLRRYFERELAAGNWPLVAVARGAGGVMLGWQTDLGPRFCTRWRGSYVARERHPDDPTPGHQHVPPVRECREGKP